jgi:dTDP-glucose 4,6-dehydratase
LVTGGAGFIGANFIHYWLNTHSADRMVVLDALTYAGNLSSLAPVLNDSRLRFVHGSIGDTALVESLLMEERLDTVVHFAAESHVDRSIAGPDAFIDTNVIGTHSLLKAARRVWLQDGPGRTHRFHQVSTDEVYGSLGPKDPAFEEGTSYAPNSPYAASKAAADHLVRAYHHTYGLNVTTSNCSNNYGPYQFPEKLIPLMIVNALRGKPLPIYGDGLNIRDWLFVEDHCRAIDKVIEHGMSGRSYNVGGNTELTNRQVVNAVCIAVDTAFAADPELAVRYPECPSARSASCESLITFVKDRPGHDRRYAVDSRRLAAELGSMPRVTFEVGLADTLSWYLTNESWWQDILRGSYREWARQHYGIG